MGDDEKNVSKAFDQTGEGGGGYILFIHNNLDNTLIKVQREVRSVTLTFCTFILS